MAVKTLPRGLFIFFRDLDMGTTDADIQKIIADRTGVILPLERILTKKVDFTHVRAIVSFDSQSVARILTWALSDDRDRGGNPLVAALAMERQRENAA